MINYVDFRKIKEEIGENAYQSLIDCGAITVSREEDEPIRMGFMTYDGRGSFFSKKPSNILVNAKNFIFAIPAMVTAGAGLFSDSILFKVCSFLLIWKEVNDCTTVEISEIEAYTWLALWGVAKRKKISVEHGYSALLNYLDLNGKEPISRNQYEDALDSLKRIFALDLVNGEVRLREKVLKKCR